MENTGPARERGYYWVTWPMCRPEVSEWTGTCWYRPGSDRGWHEPRSINPERLEVPEGQDDPQITLKPCPFCGGKAVYGRIVDEDSRDFDGQFISCEEAGCGVSTGLEFATMEDVKPSLAATWNRRAP